jgi:signal transduction histidine kinase
MISPTPAGALSPWHRRLRTGAFLGTWLGATPAAFAQSAAVPVTRFGGPEVAWIASVCALIVLIALVAAIAWALSLHRRLRHQADELRSAQGLRELLDVWQWRTDTDHRLVELRPPQGALPDEWTRAIAHPALWQHFEIAPDRLAALHAQLDSRAGFAKVPAHHGARAFTLRGTPRFDADGRFSHYVGTARPLDNPLSHQTGPLLQAIPAPALQVSMSASTRGSSHGDASCWQVQAGNTAAAQWLDVAEPRLAGMHWADVAERMPMPAQLAARQLTSLNVASVVALSDGSQLRVAPLASTGEDAHRAAWLVFGGPGHAADSTRSQDLEAFSYTVSHDLRAPIRVVEGFAKILKEDYGRQLDRIGNDHLDRVLGAAARMNSMIDSLLALAQLSSQPLARQPINLSQLVGYILDDLRRHDPERNVRVEIEPGLHTQGDATLMRVALENLLGNAWKYTAKRADACIWFEGSEFEGRPAFTVRDNGAGFDMRFSDRLFGVFQRLHSATEFQGTGVGLASVRRIIRRHGGDVWAEGAVDQGARFQFWIGSQAS